MIESLENNEVILLMYVADELPPQDRKEVDQLLSSDAGMRAQLQQLSAAWEQTHRVMAESDASHVAAPGASARQATVSRNIGRAMRQEITRRAASVAVVPTARPLAYPWYFYPAASAAAVLLAFLVWWGNSGSDVIAPYATHGRMARVTPATTEPAVADANIKLANEIEQVFSSNNDADNALLALRDDHGAGMDLEGNEQ